MEELLRIREQEFSKKTRDLEDIRGILSQTEKELSGLRSDQQKLQGQISESQEKERLIE